MSSRHRAASHDDRLFQSIEGLTVSGIVSPLTELTRVVEFPHFDGAFIESVEQSCFDAHPAEILSERLPVGAAAADRAVVDTDHSIAPNIGGRLA